MQNVRIETPLHKALRAHRDSCLDCQADAVRPKFSQALSCKVYIGIVNQATASRVIQEGPRMPHTWLSIQEATNV
jgi:hypothetical protein